MEAVERLRNSFRKSASALISAKVVLTCMVYVGFAISGIVEHGITVALSPSNFSLVFPETGVGGDGKGAARARRYCDPPNMTALAIYYDSSEEINVEDNYDFAQLQEMYFQTNLSAHEEMEFALKKIYLLGTLVSPIPASRLVANIGPKKVFGYSLLGAAASTLLVPAAWLTVAHIAIRFFQGLFCGALIPSAHVLAVNWFPPHRRSSFVSWYSGKYIGYALCELLTVRVLQTIGPGAIYYLTSTLTVIWFLPWSMIVFSTPEKYAKHVGREKTPTASSSAVSKPGGFPLKRLLCSRPFWMSIGVVFGGYCGQTSINVVMRLYLKYVYSVSDGLLSAIPFILHSIFAISCGYLVDYIQEIRFVSVTSSRRMFVYVSHFIPAGLLFVIGFVGCDSTAPVLLYSLAVIITGANYSGAFCSPLDIAPNYAGTIVAFCCTFGSAGSILMTYLLTQVLDGEVLGSWRFAFSLTSLILLVSSIFFMLRGSGAVQTWNDPQESEEEEEEMRTSEKSDRSQEGRHSVIAPLPVASKPRTKSIYSVEKKILKVLYVQEPDRFTRVRAYSTSLTNERPVGGPHNLYRPTNRKRASIS